MYCKTYSGDYNRVSLLISSFNKYNVDKIPLFLSVPESELQLFEKFSSDTIEIITDESYAGKYFTNERLSGLPVGYCNQEICKLAFWESKVAKNYLCLDSDLLFIRDFHESDFIIHSFSSLIIIFII